MFDRFPILILTVLSGLGLSSCSTSSTSEDQKIAQGTQELPKKLEGWYLKSDDPPTYFPDGYGRNNEPNMLQDEWVEDGDGGTKWLIPRNGAGGRSPKELADEALAMQSVQVKRKRIAESAVDRAVEILGEFEYGP